MDRQEYSDGIYDFESSEHHAHQRSVSRSKKFLNKLEVRLGLSLIMAMGGGIYSDMVGADIKSAEEACSVPHETDQSGVECVDLSLVSELAPTFIWLSSGLGASAVALYSIRHTKEES